MAVCTLDDYLATHWASISKEELKQPVPTVLGNKVAPQIDEWECLANFISVPQVEVHDITVKYRNHPRNQPLALIKRWREIHGQNATYIMLIEGLEQIGKRDIIETILAYYKREKKVQGVKKWLYGLMFLWSFIVNFWSSGLRIIQRLFLLYISWKIAQEIVPNFLPLNETVPLFSDLLKLQYNTLSRQFMNNVNALDVLKSRNNDLPKAAELFVGREQDLKNATDKLSSYSVVNINGAPGFGKSQLAIQAGHVLVDTVPVRYITADEKLLLQGIDNNMRIDFLDLHEWSKRIDSRTVLILDDCDRILESEFRNKFLDTLCELVQLSNHNLHIAVVSIETLRLSMSNCNFTTLEVHPISNTSSVKLLRKLVPPETSDEDLYSIADLVEGCPLALRVVGTLLNEKGTEYTQELIEELRVRLTAVMKTDSRKQFHELMDFVSECMKTRELEFCGKAISQFPGSFSQLAGEGIIHHSDLCIKEFVTFSLLEERYYASFPTYYMHRLIKGYFNESVAVADRREFNGRFHQYYVKFFLRFTKEYNLDDRTRYMALTSEAHNIAFFLSLLNTNVNIYSNVSAQELAVLAFLEKESYTELQNIKFLFQQFMEHLNEVCYYLNYITCGDLYARIIPQLRHVCKCRNISDYLQNLFHVSSKSSCTTIFKCDIVGQLLTQPVVLSKLPYSEKAYIDRLAFFHCGWLTDVTRGPYETIILVVHLVSAAIPMISNQYFRGFVSILIYYFIKDSVIKHFDLELAMKFVCLVTFRVIICTSLINFVYIIIRCFSRRPLEVVGRFLDVGIVFLFLFAEYFYINLYEVNICQFLPYCY